MALQYDLAPFSGKTSLISFGAERRELDFARVRSFHPPRHNPPRLNAPTPGASGGATDDGATLDIDALWRAIEAVPTPTPFAPTPVFLATKVRPSLAGAALMVAIWRRRFLAAGLSVGAGVGLALEPSASIAWAAAGVGGAYLAAALPKRAADVAQAARAIEKQFVQGLRRWWDQCSSAGFLEAKAQLDAAHADLTLLDSEEKRRIEVLALDRRAEQLRHYLKRAQIGGDKIKGVGPRRLARLASHGVQSAFDVTASRVSRVPGIGPVTTQALLSWRSQIEGQFVPHDPRKSPQDRARIAMIKDDIARRGAPLRAILQDGPRRLASLGAAVESRRRFADPELDELHDRWLQAGADLKICGQRIDPLPISSTTWTPGRSLRLRRQALGMMRQRFA
jgi:hypothetical protein